VLRDGQSATEQEIIDFCQTRMACYKVPKLVEFRPALPKNRVGKILRRSLIAEELAKTQHATSRAS
jgi:long-chain acyl-CoA synthetase